MTESNITTEGAEVNDMPASINDSLEAIVTTASSQAGELRFCWWTEDDGQRHAELAVVAGDIEADYCGPWPRP